MNLQIHHIGYLVKKIEKATKEFQKLGYQIQKDTVYDPIREANINFLEKDGYVVELISPATETSVVAGLMKRYKNSPYHICYISHDLNADLEALTSNGFTAIDTPTEAPALENKRVVFLMNPNMGMIELLENK